MDFATIMSAISSVGFPIVFCFVLYKTITDIQKAHKEETDKMVEAIHNNTLVVQKLVDKIGDDKDEQKE